MSTFNIFREPPPPCSLAAGHDLARLAQGLRCVIGREIAGVFLTRYSGERTRIVLVFADGMNYELFGSGMLSGGRSVQLGGIDDVRRVLTDDAALEVFELTRYTGPAR